MKERAQRRGAEGARRCEGRIWCSPLTPALSSPRKRGVANVSCWRGWEKESAHLRRDHGHVVRRFGHADELSEVPEDLVGDGGGAAGAVGGFERVDQALAAEAVALEVDAVEQAVGVEQERVVRLQV